MNYPARLTAALLVAVTASTPAPARALLFAHSVPPESFLDYHVDTVPQLAFEVTYDKAVRARLARHFHLSGAAMGAYVRDNLVLSRLRASLRTRVYAVTGRGREHFTVMTLKAGTPVFALRGTGQPILRLACGNPLVSTLPAAPKKKKLVAFKPPVRAFVKPLVKTLVKPMRMTLITPYTTSAGVMPAAWSVPTITTSGSSLLFTKGLASGVGWLALLPVAGLAAALPTQHGGGGAQSTSPPSDNPQVFPPPTNTPTAAPDVPGGGTGGTPPGSGGGTPTGPSPGPYPVPEPSPVWVFALGGLALGALRLAKLRSGSR